MLNPSPAETATRAAVIRAVLEHIRSGAVLRLPKGLEVSPFVGEIDGFRFRFEGEDDLLHLSIERIDRGRLTVEEAQKVVEFLLPDLLPSLIWLRPGEFSQHFYCAHDDLRQSFEDDA